jgi:hypothetical protein
MPRILSLSVRSLLTLLLLASFAIAQSTTTGALAGTVTDPSGAVVAGAKVSAKGAESGEAGTAITNSNGYYRIPLLKPGSYTVSVTAQGFNSASNATAVAVGQTTTADIKLAVTGASQTVEVSADVLGVQTESASVNTTFSTDQIQYVPNGGNDISYVAQTAPGSVMNTQAGYGNFSSYGLPGTSNLFTLDGMNDNDPFLNLNNSGATNLLLGQNEIQEATVVSNGYSGQYGQLAGATVNYVTKSGSNVWHGNAVWWWNGRAMNANDWFNNHTGTPRPFDNANQWAASIGGPIKKDKAYFFVDYEGLRVLLPTSTKVTIPTPAFQTQIINTLTANGLTNSIPFYNTMFDLWNNAPGSGSAVPRAFTAGDNGGCAGFASSGPGANANGFGTFGDPTQATPLPCVEDFRSTSGNFTHEWLLGGRFDYVFSDRDRLFLRVQTDHGVQATYTDPLDPVFNAVSTQPEYQGQASWTHVFNNSSVNNFVASAQWYTAIFSTPDLNASITKFPTTMLLNDGSLTTVGGLDYIWPQGRNVTQYQFVDDYSKTFGKHTLKLGVNYHRNDVSDFDFGFFNSGLEIPLGLDSFVNGGTDPVSGDISILLQSFPQSLNQPIALYGLGFYVEDDWKVRSNLTLNLTLRLDHTSNPVCQTNCFADLSSPFTNIALDPTGDVPYNQTILTGRHQLSRKTDPLTVGPRIGFAWSPFTNTVLRGGFGLFYDSFPATIADNLSQNPPLDPQFTQFCNNLAPTETAANACGIFPNGNMFADAAAANTAFQAGFSTGGTANTIFGGPAPLNITATPAVTHTPRYQEWNLTLQQMLGKNTSFSINYVGNHGIHEAVQNNSLNAWCPGCTFDTPEGPLPSAGPPDARFTSVNQIQTVAVSNYNGVTFSVQQRFHSLQLQANYTYGHALDEISNGGFLPFNFGTNEGVLFPQDPNNLRRFNYGNADYDTTHYFSMNYVWGMPFDRFFHGGKGWQALYGGWQLSGTIFYRTGLPFTVTDSASTGLISSTGYGGTVFADPNTFVQPNCGAAAADAPCINASNFNGPGLAQFGDQRRNQFRGPNFFDTDMTLTKTFGVPGTERAHIGIALQAFNLFNHPNFDQPVNDLSNPQFGLITRTVNSPTSILGSFLGGDASPRLLQLNLRFVF